MARKSKRNKTLIALLIAGTLPWVIVLAIKLGQRGLGLIHHLPAWQETAIWISLSAILGLGIGYLIYRSSRHLAITKIHQAKDRPRKLGVRLFGGGFIDILSKIASDPEIRFKATGFAFVPRSIKGDIKTTNHEEPFPVVELPVREAIKSWQGACAARDKEVTIASGEYSSWLSRQKDQIRCLCDIVGKGKGHTGLSCLYRWGWLRKPDVAKFLFIVFDPEEKRIEESPEGVEEEVDE